MQIRIFNTVDFPENCYAAIFSDGIFLVDPGEYTAELDAFVRENTDNIKYILLTHKHFDHVRGAVNVKKLCPDAKIVIHSLDADGLNDPIKSLATYFGFEQNNITADILCEDGDIINLGDTKIKVLHTPGHSEGGVCYIVENAIFCGDTLFKSSCGRTDFPGGSGCVLSQSLKKLKDIKGNYTLYPGHGEITSLNEERAYNPYMRML